MKLFGLVVGMWLVGASSALALTALPATPVAPYEPVSVAQPVVEARTYLGTLVDFPDTYEISSPEEFSLSLQVATVPEQATIPQLSVIVVAVNQSGVEEVTRLAFADSAWEPGRQSVTGLTELVGPNYTSTVPAGTYHIEVSSPDNTGQYLLTVGTESRAGYFATVRSIIVMYDFYGASKWGIVRSPYLYYPLGAVALLIGLIVVWQRRRALRYA